MAPANRLLLAVSVALLGAGIGGALSVPGPARHHTRPASPPASAAPAPPAPGGPAPPASAALAGRLLVPLDMGGYYRSDPTAATALLDSAPCLAGFHPAAGTAGLAATALVNRVDYRSVPYAVEVLVSYRDAVTAYQALAASLAACHDLAFSFGGQPVAAPLRPDPLAPVGQEDAAWVGSFSAGGSSFTVSVGLALQAPEVVLVVWIDTARPSPAVMGDFASTLSAAIGKLA